MKQDAKSEGIIFDQNYDEAFEARYSFSAVGDSIYTSIIDMDAAPRRAKPNDP